MNRTDRIFFILRHNILSFNNIEKLFYPRLSIQNRSNNNAKTYISFFNWIYFSNCQILRRYLRFLGVETTEWNRGREARSSRFIVVRGDRLTNNNPGDSALTSSRKIRSEATLYCSRNCMQRHSFRLGTRVHRA